MDQSANIPSIASMRSTSAVSTVTISSVIGIFSLGTLRRSGQRRPHLEQLALHGVRERRKLTVVADRAGESDRRVQLVDPSVRLDARAGLRDADAPANPVWPRSPFFVAMLGMLLLLPGTRLRHTVPAKRYRDSASPGTRQSGKSERNVVVLIQQVLDAQSTIEACDETDMTR